MARTLFTPDSGWTRFSRISCILKERRALKGDLYYKNGKSEIAF